MDKVALKKFALSARSKLREGVENRARIFGIEASGISSSNQLEEALIINGLVVNEQHKNAYALLTSKLTNFDTEQSYEEAYISVMEEVSYTWFNRIIAIRFMELNDFLPIRMRLLSSETIGKNEPDAVTSIMDIIGELDLDEELVWKMRENNSSVNEMFKYVFVHQCQIFGKTLPGVFHQVESIEELLLPDNLLADSGMISELANSGIPDSDWEEVEIIGWLYQYYNSEVKERVGGLKNNSVSKRHLPTVTQLFTPKWIVKYMLENSLGKLYMGLFPESKLKREWSFYFESNSQKPYLFPNEVKSLEDINLIDPASGSGHILLEAFELLYSMYLEQGYLESEIPKLIIEQNLHGLEIDERSYQITEISLLLQVLKKFPNYLRNSNHERIESNVQVFFESDKFISVEALEFIFGEEDVLFIQELERLYMDCKQYGSLIQLPIYDYKNLLDSLQQKLLVDEVDLYEESLLLELKEKLIPILKTSILLTNKYEVICTNPPYHNKFNPNLKRFMRKNYPMTKSDLYSAFIEKAVKMTSKNGYVAVMTPYTWMFISSHEKLREFLIAQGTISNLVQLEYSAFEDATVPLCTFVIQNQKENDIGIYVRLEDFKGADIQPIKVKEAAGNHQLEYVYKRGTKSFSSIKGSPLAYWSSENVYKIFKNNSVLSDVSDARLGMATADNNLFLRFWFEVKHSSINFDALNRDCAINSKARWFPYNKGGSFRKWYGNNEYVVNWLNDGEDIRDFKDSKGKVRSHNYNLDYIFRPSLSWSALTSGVFSVRYSRGGFLFDNAGSSLFSKDGLILKYIQGLLSTKIMTLFFPLINPTLNYQPGTVGNIPYIFSLAFKNEIEQVVDSSIKLSKSDWDSFETSWDFEQHPFLTYKSDKTLRDSYLKWEQVANNRFTALKGNEEELNRIFIDLYGLQDELSPEVPDKEITVRHAELRRDVRSFLSYLVGVMFGRYSLDEAGLIYAGGKFSYENYHSYEVDKDNIIPITEQGYMEDDIVSRVEALLVIIYGQDSLEENLQFIACGLDGILESKETVDSRDRIRTYFVKDFYKDHVKIFQKRPIYWQITSGKFGTFKCLIYLHRYDSYSLARVRTGYFLPLMKRLDGLTKQEEITIKTNISNKEVNKARKRQETVFKEIEELRSYDLLLNHMSNRQVELNLDDGIKVNYAKFQGIKISDDNGKLRNRNIFEKI